ncbi:MAG: hypothetical protein ACOYEL_05040 [Saccharofermentanales bacterium]|jgi:hypothetical protein
MITLLIPFLAIYVFIIWQLYKRDRSILINDIFWLFSSWIMMFGIYLFSGINYYYKVSLNDLLYVIAFFVFYLLGRYIGLKSKNQHGYKPYSIKVSDNTLLVLTIFGALLRIIDVIRLNGFLNIDRNNVQSSFIGIIGSFFSPIGLPLFFLIAFRAKKNQKRIPAKAFVALIMYVLPVILLSGRLNLVFALIALVIVLLGVEAQTNETEYRVERKVPRRQKVLIAILLGLGIFTFLAYSNFIISNRFSSFERLLLASGLNESFSIEETSLFFYSKFGAFGSLVFQILNYYSAQFKNIALIVDNFRGPYSWGLMQMPYIARRTDFFENIVDRTNDALLVATSRGSRGFTGFGSTWITVVGDMVIDFGLMGALLVVFIIGILIGRKRAVYIKNPESPYEFTIQAMLCVCMFFTIQLSPFFETSLVYGFIWVWLLSHFKIGHIKS